MRAARDEIGRLQHHAIAVSERRRDLPGGNRDREIPRRDHPDDAERFARDFHVHARTCRGDFLARQPHAFAGEELEDLPGADGFADAFDQRLAFLARQQFPELILARDDFVADALQDVMPLLDRGARPGRECRLGRGDRFLRISRAGARKVADHVLGVRRVQVLRVVLRFDPFAANEILCMNRHIQFLPIISLCA